MRIVKKSTELSETYISFICFFQAEWWNLESFWCWALLKPSCAAPQVMSFKLNLPIQLLKMSEMHQISQAHNISWNLYFTFSKRLKRGPPVEVPSVKNKQTRALNCQHRGFYCKIYKSAIAAKFEKASTDL